MRSVRTLLILISLAEAFAEDISDCTVAGETCLKTSNGSFIQARREDPRNLFSPWSLEIVKECKRPMRWYIEYYRERVAIKPDWVAFEYLIADAHGTVALERGPTLDQKLWTPRTNEDGSWSFKSFHGGWLNVYDNGTLSTVEDTAHSSSNFRLISREDLTFHSHQASYPPKYADEAAGVHCIKTSHDTFLRGNISIAVASKCGSCGQWKLEIADTGLVYLKPNCSFSEATLNAHRSGSVSIWTNIMRASERWRPFKNDDGSWSFQSAHGTWLRTQADGTVSLQLKLGEDGKFWLESSEDQSPITSTLLPSITTTIPSSTESSITTNAPVTITSSTTAAIPSTTTSTISITTTTALPSTHISTAVYSTSSTSTLSSSTTIPRATSTSVTPAETSTITTTITSSTISSPEDSVTLQPEALLQEETHQGDDVYRWPLEYTITLLVAVIVIVFLIVSSIFIRRRNEVIQKEVKQNESVMESHKLLE